MTAKTTTQHTVKFYATSSKVADAYRSAAKRNKDFARFSWMHEHGHREAARSFGKSVGKFQVVVLSQVEDDIRAIADEHTELMLSKAFHLLFTKSTTDPNEIARWMWKSGIRSDHRLHIIQADDLGGRQVSDLLGRVCSAVRPDGSRGSIIDAYLAKDVLSVLGPKHRTLHVPVGSIPSLRRQPPIVLKNFEIDPDGSFIYWPDIDVHLGWNQFVQAVDPEEFHKAQQLSEEFNQRYGAAIRKVREDAGFLQSEIAGLTDRQLRRIEQGECRATSGAIATLAKAHGLEVNAYMEKLAKAMH